MDFYRYSVSVLDFFGCVGWVFCFGVVGVFCRGHTYDYNFRIYKSHEITLATLKNLLMKDTKNKK